MKRYFLATLLVLFAACSTAPEGVGETTVIETADGAIIVDTFTTTATVTGIDSAKRKVTLVTPGGTKSTYQAGPEMINFEQIRIGDQVRATVTEEVAVFIGSGAPPSAIAASAVALAPLGAKPGGVRVDTTQVTVKITAVDAKSRNVTFELPDGTTKKFKAGKKVDLSAVRPGDNVTVQVSEGLALTVERP
jgi:Cu/Ag efflux protein CusF